MKKESIEEHIPEEEEIKMQELNEITEASIVEELTPLTHNNDSRGSESPDPIEDETLENDNDFTINFKFEDEQQNDV